MIRCWNVTAEVSPLGYSRSPLGELWLWESLVSPAQLHTPPLILSPHTVTKSSRALELHQHTIPAHHLPHHHLKDFTRSQVSLKFSCFRRKVLCAAESVFPRGRTLTDWDSRPAAGHSSSSAGNLQFIFTTFLYFSSVFAYLDFGFIFCILDFNFAFCVFDILCLIFYIFVCVCTSVLYLCFIEEAIKWLVPRILV